MSHLDLNLDSRRKIAARYAEATGSNLLDGRIHGIAVRQRSLALRVFAAFTRIRAAAQTVHGNSHALVSFLGNGTVAHSARVETLSDACGRLNLFQRNRGTISYEVEQIAQADRTPFLMQMIAVFLEHLIIALTASMLQQVDGLRIDKVFFTALRTPLGKAQGRQLLGCRRVEDSHSVVVALVLFALNIGNAQAAHTGNGASKILINELLLETNSLEDLSRMVALNRRNTHLRHDGGNSRGYRLVVVRNALFGRYGQSALCRQIGNALMCHIGVNARSGIANQSSEVVCGNGITCLDHKIGKGANAHTDKMVVNRRNRQERRNRHFAFCSTVGKHDDAYPVAHSLLNAACQVFERLFQCVFTVFATIRSAETLSLEANAINRADAIELILRQHRAIEANQLACCAGIFQKIAVVANIEHARSNQALTQSIDRWIGYLGKQLVEIIEEGTVLFRKACKRGIDTHGSQGHTALFSHGANHLIHVIPVVAQLCHAYGHRNLGIARSIGLNRCIKIGNFDLLFLYPIAVGLFLCIAGAQFVIPNNAIGRSVDLHHFARTKATCSKDVGGLDFDGSNLG